MTEIDRSSELYRRLTTFEFKTTGWKGKSLLSEIQKFIQREQMPITVRQAFYHLLSVGLIKHDQYQQVVELLVRARKEKKKGIDWDDISESTRPSYRLHCYDDLVTYLTVEKDKYFREIFRKGFQNNFIMVFLEKDALSDVVYRAIAYYFVPIIVTRGYMSWGGFYQKVVKIYEKTFPLGEFNWKVLCLYDFDPFGQDQFRLLKEQFQFFKINADIRLIALTEPQIIKLNLKTIPQPKPKKGEPKKRFVKEWLKLRNWRCELDALTPTQLKNIVFREVLDLLDKKAYDLEMDKWRLERASIGIQEPYLGFTSDLEQANDKIALNQIRQKLGLSPIP